jgi:hypothetical protein
MSHHTRQPMPLNADDEFQLNVLLASQPLAIRIDESAMRVHGLNARGQEQVCTLKPDRSDRQYLKSVRLLLAEKAGFPGGYPAQLERWSAMGQIRSSGNARLLLLAEPEAVIAVSTSVDLSAELAQRAWWALPTTDNARHLLARPTLLDKHCGATIAAHLVEHLPFETSAGDISQTVSCVLRSRLISSAQLEALWQRAQRRCCYMLGFLCTPDCLPQTANETACSAEVIPEGLIANGNVFAVALSHIFSAKGQRFIHCARLALQKPEDQEIVGTLLTTIADFFTQGRLPGATTGDWTAVTAQVDRHIADAATTNQQLHELLASTPALRDQTRAMLILSLLGDKTVQSTLSGSTSTGALMRRKLSPVTTMIKAELAILTA